MSFPYQDREIFMTLKYPKQPSSQKTTPQFLLTHKTDATRVRKSSGSYVDGKWVEGGVTNTTIQVNIQPMRGHELMSLPEADRSKEWVKFYTTSDIRGIGEGVPSTPPDLLVWDGRTFEVAKVLTYKMGVLNHNKVIAARIPVSAGE